LRRAGRRGKEVNTLKIHAPRHRRKTRCGEPERIDSILNRVMGRLAQPARPTPPDKAALEVVVNILREALEHIPDIPRSARSSMGTAIDLITGEWPGTTLERMGGGRR
jgi:hypothetical protein